MNDMTKPTMTEMAAILQAHPDFQVLRRFVPRDSYGTAPDGVVLSKGIILDTETTGRDANNDKIIELGMIKFEFCAETGRVFRITDTYNGLEDPGMPISPEATAVNGITDDMVKGQTLDDARVEEMVADADIIIAHNSRFDRAFMERRMPIFKGKAWGCSLQQVRWEDEGLGSAKLDYLCYKFGFFFEAHRAEADCRALLEMLQCELPVSKVPVLKLIIDSYRNVEVNIAAIGAPFEAKDLLKGRGYRWDPNEKFWHIGLADDAARESEMEWLRTVVHRGKNFRVGVLKIDAFSRFSDRPSVRESVYA